MDCKGNTEDCFLRHKRQDDTEKKINEMYDIICGGIHPENSLSTKVNEMLNENKSVKNFIKSCIVSLVILIFWCGYQYAVLHNCEQKIDKLETRIESISR